MTPRDYFAASAPITMREAWEIWTGRPHFTDGITTEHEAKRFFEWFAELRGKYADAMMVEREKQNEEA